MLALPNGLIIVCSFEFGLILELRFVYSYQLQKYHGHGSFVVPIDPSDVETWGDKEHRLAQVAETTVIHKDIVEVNTSLQSQLVSCNARLAKCFDFCGVAGIKSDLVGG